MLPAILMNVIKALVMDKAQTLVADQAKKAIEDVLDGDAKKELDKIINEDVSHKFKSLSDMLK